MKALISTLLLHVLLAMPLCAGNVFSLIPLPAQIIAGQGTFRFPHKLSFSTAAYSGDSIGIVFTDFGKKFTEVTGITLNKTTSERALLRLALDSRLGAEAYELDITRKRITIKAARPAGFFYALQTISQLLPSRAVAAGTVGAEAKKWSLPVVKIYDAPRFGWRGFMLDTGRHFFDTDAIKKILDLMSVYKMNRFHWHLTDDQGWRIEIKKYPRLTSVGAWRNSEVLGWGDTAPDGMRYGGYYTQADVREIVKYARERFIEIVPEVDIPGHSQAAVAAYPEFLACDPLQKHEVWLWQGISSDVINVANPQAVQFAKDVTDELIEMFPFGCIHLGGDECPTEKWKKNADCRQLLAQLGSTNYRDLQIHYYQQIKKHIDAKPASQRRRLIFWNEVLYGNTTPLGKDITIMAWVNAQKSAYDAAQKGMNTILSPWIPYYINRKQTALPGEPHSQGTGTETLQAVYNYIPMQNVPVNLKSQYAGIQANFWTEWVKDVSTQQYIMLPRLAAIAEAAWTPQALRNYDSFVERLQAERDYYIMKGVSFGRHVFK